MFHKYCIILFSFNLIEGVCHFSFMFSHPCFWISTGLANVKFITFFASYLVNNIRLEFNCYLIFWGEPSENENWTHSGYWNLICSSWDDERQTKSGSMRNNKSVPIYGFDIQVGSSCIRLIIQDFSLLKNYFKIRMKIS